MRQLKRSRSLRLEQIKASLTASMTRPGPADTRNRFPLSTRVLGWPGPASYSQPCFAEKLGPAWAWALAGQESPDTSVSGQSLGWAETWDWDILDKRIIARSQSIEAVTSNWSIIGPGERAESGKVLRPCPVWGRDQLVLWCLSTKYPSRSIVDWLNLDIWQRFMEARPYNWLNFMELGFQVMGVNLILASSTR